MYTGPFLKLLRMQKLKIYKTTNKSIPRSKIDSQKPFRKCIAPYLKGVNYSYIG